MSVEQELLTRSGSQCELCGSKDDLSVYAVAPSDESAAQSVLLCATCRGQVEDSSTLEESHWHCLNDSMWSEHPAVKVLSYRLLKQLGNQDLLDMIYLEEDEKAWAEAGMESGGDDKAPTLDSNGARLEAGDTVTIIKDLEVKGAGFTAKRGTAVRNIALTDNPEQIEGRVNGTRIVLLTKFLKKQ